VDEHEHINDLTVHRNFYEMADRLTGKGDYPNLTDGERLRKSLLATLGITIYAIKNDLNRAATYQTWSHASKNSATELFAGRALPFNPGEKKHSRADLRKLCSFQKRCDKLIEEIKHAESGEFWLRDELKISEITRNGLDFCYDAGLFIGQWSAKVDQNSADRQKKNPALMEYAAFSVKEHPSWSAARVFFALPRKDQALNIRRTLIHLDSSRERICCTSPDGKKTEIKERAFRNYVADAREQLAR
jgi:hypothetical protein